MDFSVWSENDMLNRGVQHEGILEGSSRKLSVCFKIKHSNPCHKICIRSSEVNTSIWSVIITSHVSSKKKKTCYKNWILFFLYDAVLTTKAKDRRLKRSARVWLFISQLQATCLRTFSFVAIGSVSEKIKHSTGFGTNPLRVLSAE